MFKVELNKNYTNFRNIENFNLFLEEVQKLVPNYDINFNERLKCFKWANNKNTYTIYVNDWELSWMPNAFDNRNYIDFTLSKTLDEESKYLKIDNTVIKLENTTVNPEKDMIELASEKLTELFKILKLDLTDPNLINTPKRISKMFVNETLKWLYSEPPKITTFPNEWEEKYEWMVVVKDIEVHSLCSHHWQNFDWKVTIAYIPWKKVVWLSKFARVVDYWSRRPQLQERLMKQIFNHLKEILETDNIAITMNCIHNCMAVRGVKEHEASTSTALMRGLFLHSEATRNEFLFHAKK